MASSVSDARIKVSFLPAVADTSAPTVAELGAGQALEQFITQDGLELPTETESVDTTALASVFETALPGRRNMSGSQLTLLQQGKAVAPWTTFDDNPEGFLVVRHRVPAAQAWAADDEVEVYTVQAGVRSEQPTAANETDRFTVKIHHTAPPVMDATVA